jgi:hypothetical protein
MNFFIIALFLSSFETYYPSHFVMNLFFFFRFTFFPFEENDKQHC